MCKKDFFSKHERYAIKTEPNRLKRYICLYRSTIIGYKASPPFSLCSLTPNNFLCSASQHRWPRRRQRRRWRRRRSRDSLERGRSIWGLSRYLPNMTNGPGGFSSGGGGSGGGFCPEGVSGFSSLSLSFLFSASGVTCWPCFWSSSTKAGKQASLSIP